jgi:hypothetical protein
MVAAAGIALMLGAGAQARSGADLSLEVTFSYTGDISVALPDGTPVGTQSGSPTVIPAGFYTVAMSGPGCIQVPYFELYGPGVGVLDNLEGGELANDSTVVDLQPDATYTWSNSGIPNTTYTFTTSSSVLGTPPVAPPVKSSGGAAPANGDVVGSALVVPFRGMLAGRVSSTGGMSLTYAGKPATKLAAGRYTLTVADRSPTSGLLLERSGKAALTLSHGAFVGTRTASVDLTPGRWSFTAVAGTKTKTLSFSVA